MYKCIVICWTYFCVVQIFVRANTNEDYQLSTVQLIKKNGYPAEIYSNVITEDGYLLDIYRIPHGKFEKKKRSRIPVVLMHGLWRTSEDYVITGSKKSLAFLLAERGYDIWLPNARGSPYSRKHLTLNPDVDADFWKFSWHEIGYYDLPAAFKLIRNVTKMERLSYIGVSEGNTYFYVLASMRPEYNKNVTIMISLGPTAFLSHINPLIKMGAAYEPIFASLSKQLGVYEGKQITQLIWLAGRLFCTREGFFQNTCKDIISLIGGYYSNQTDVAFVPAAVLNGLTGAVRQYLHHMQNVNSGGFRQFDFGRKVNLKSYGTPVPPSYNLSKITSPVVLFYSDGDWISTTPDVERLCAELGNCAYTYKVSLSEFGHFDFVIAKDVVDLLYQKVFYILDKLNNK